MTEADCMAAWFRYVKESEGQDRGSVREIMAWDRYLAVVQEWRNQR